MAIRELHKEQGFTISLLCKVADIARSSYYKWLNRTPSKREVQNKKIIKDMWKIHEKRDGIFGYRRMTINVNRRLKKTFNEKRIHRLMKVAGIECVIRRKKKPYTHSPPKHIAENLLNREFKADKPNEKWVTDVTEMKHGKTSKAYLCAVRDLYDGKIISYSLGHRNNNNLVFKTIDAAIDSLKTGETPLIHSDRGAQYTSISFKNKISEAKMKQSMSRPGKCIDNSPMESFWGALKCEKYYLKTFETFEELSKAIDEYIDFYNNDRYQKGLNGLSPQEFRDLAS